MALEQVAEDFLAKTLELGAAIARRRASEFLTPADLNVALERLWCACQNIFTLVGGLRMSPQPMQTCKPDCDCRRCLVHCRLTCLDLHRQRRSPLVVADLLTCCRATSIHACSVPLADRRFIFPLTGRRSAALLGPE